MEIETMAYPVKWFASEMQGAPSLGDTTEGALTALLKAIMVTGFGQLSISNLSWDAAESAAVATVQSGHKYLQDSVVLIEGVSPAAYNGEHRVKKVDTTRVWVELDGGNPGSAGSGAAMTMKVAPLGWTLTHESGDGKVAIYRPTDISASGNVSLCIDNTAWSGWTGSNAWLAKVALIEDVVDINTYTLIYEHRWPATKRYSDGRWDLIGDPQLFYFLPAYATANYQFVYCFGYIRSVRPGDRYHAFLNFYPGLSGADATRGWQQGAGLGNTSYGNAFPVFDNTFNQILARAYTQLFGQTGVWMKGIFSRFGIGLNIPNAPDNGFYMSTDPIILLETGGHLRGYLPGRIVRFIRVGYAESQATGGQVTLMGFDITGPWR
jgi:hypothetical protein